MPGARAASCSGSSPPRTRSSTTPWGGPQRGAGADGARAGGGDRAPRRPGTVVPHRGAAVGRLVLVRPGERVAVDGVVLGRRDRHRPVGDHRRVDPGRQAGRRYRLRGDDQRRTARSRCGSTACTRRARWPGSSQFVEQAQEEKSATQRFTDRFEGWYAVGVIAFSTLVCGDALARASVRAGSRRSTAR